MLISPFSAIPSWEGYEYQGHIAIYVVLQKIKSLLTRSIDIKASKYILEIEGAEDFSIKDGNQYLTLHQVKYGALTLDNKDKFCFLISVLQYQAHKGYYHITPCNTLSDDFVKSTYETIITLKNEFAKEVKNADNNASPADKEKAEKEYIVIEKVTGNHPKGSKYSILKYALSSMGLDVSKNNIENIIESIQSELDDYKDKLFVDEKNVDESTFVSVYNDLFDKASDVKNASCILIAEILDILYPSWKVSYSSSDPIPYPQFVYNHVFTFLKQKINRCHEENVTNCQIDFSEIFHMISRDYRAELNSITYKYYMIWESIQKSFESYPQKASSTCSSTSCFNCADKPSCNLYRQKKLIESINDDEIHSFLYRLMLKEPVGNPNNLPGDNLIHRLLTCLLKEIDCLCVEENHLIQAQKRGHFYRMTLDSSGESSELQEQLLKEMSQSVDDKLLLYETDVLITDQLNQADFLVNGISSMVLGENEYTELESITSDSIEKIRKNSNKPKIMRLVDRVVAKEELK